MQDVLHCHKVSKTYADGETTTPVLHHVSLSVKPGEQVAILGSSGSGKSTLLHILAGLDKPSEGDVFFQDKKITALNSAQLAALRNQEMGFIYQFHRMTKHVLA